MKKEILFFVGLISVLASNAQEKPVTEKAKDSIKTEVITIVTAYNPKISDATKIMQIPKIIILEKSTKKKLKYATFTPPVASTFIPKRGKVKGIRVEKKERLYNNLFAAGYGNFGTPYVELYIGEEIRFVQNFGILLKYLASEENIENTSLNSTFSQFKGNVFFQNKERFFDWKVNLDSERNTYNWYGLPAIDFNTSTLNSIDEAQTYNYFKVNGDIVFKDSFLGYGNLSVSSFKDAFNSSEIVVNFTAKIDFPLEFLNLNLNDVPVRSSFEYLKGGFSQGYLSQNLINYGMFTARVHPEYHHLWNGFSMKGGVILTASLDTQNSLNNFFVFPQFEVKKALIKEYLNVYTGFKSGLHTNTYKEFTDKNPYISPTQILTQTVEKSNLFFGLNGKFNHDLSFNIKGSYIEEQDKPLFIRNKSKSDGNSTRLNTINFKGYEYGNSFGVLYDDVKTTAIFAELEYDINRDITVGTNVLINSYTTQKTIDAFNLPSTDIAFYGKYNNGKWYATTNVFHVGARKDLMYSGGKSTVQMLNSFVDVNLNGGYHFTNQLSGFIRLNNVLNTKYQRFANFDTQGFQVLAGFYYKFEF